MIELADGPGVHCFRCFSTRGVVRISLTCENLYHGRKGEGPAPAVLLCVDCLRDGVKVANERGEE